MNDILTMLNVGACDFDGEQMNGVLEEVAEFDGVMMFVGGAEDGALNTTGSITAATREKARMLIEHAERVTGLDVATVWGKGSSTEHATGRAVDIMVTANGKWIGGSQDAATALGNAIADLAWEKRNEWDLAWIIWRQHIRSTSPGKGDDWRPMSSRGSLTQDHYDHPHIYFRSDRLDYVTPAVIEAKDAAPVPAKAQGIALSAAEVARATRADSAASNPTGRANHPCPADALALERALATQVEYTGPFDGSLGTNFKKAYAAFQRSLGYKGRDADGVPGIESLRVLGDRTGAFTVKA